MYIHVIHTIRCNNKIPIYICSVNISICKEFCKFKDNITKKGKQKWQLKIMVLLARHDLWSRDVHLGTTVRLAKHKSKPFSPSFHEKQSVL